MWCADDKSPGKAKDWASKQVKQKTKHLKIASFHNSQHLWNQHSSYQFPHISQTKKYHNRTNYMQRHQSIKAISWKTVTNSWRAPSKKFSGNTSSLYKENGMLSLDLMLMNNGQKQWDALKCEKPMKEEKDFWNSHTGTKWPKWILASLVRSPEEQRSIRPMASQAII